MYLFHGFNLSLKLMCYHKNKICLLTCKLLCAKQTMVLHLAGQRSELGFHVPFYRWDHVGTCS